MRPTRLLDPRFKYVSAVSTTPEHLRETFERVRREQAAERKEKTLSTVTKINRRRG